MKETQVAGIEKSEHNPIILFLIYWHLRTFAKLLIIDDTVTFQGDFQYIFI